MCSLAAHRWNVVGESSHESRYPIIIFRVLCLRVSGPWKTIELELSLKIGIAYDY